MVLGENGLINKGKEAKETSIINEEKETIKIAWNGLMIDKEANGIETTDTKFQEELNNNGNNTSVSKEEEEFLVFFINTNHTYRVDKDGNINQSGNLYYAINYELNGGTNPQKQVTAFRDGETVYLLSATKENAYFQGWYESSDFSTEPISSISNRNGDIQLYAKWLDETPSDIFTWTTTSTSATVTGFSEKGLTEYEAGNLNVLSIPRKYNNLPVTNVGNRAFFEKTTITTLALPDSMEGLGTSSFYKCSSLVKIIMPISLKVDDNIFTLCTNIRDIVLTKGTGICPNYSNNSYTPWAIANSVEGGINITIEDGIENIGNRMFYGCNGIKITNESFRTKSIQRIGNNAFYNCKQISLDFSRIYNNSLAYIGETAFYCCENMTGKLEFTHTELSRGSFYGCKKIERAVIDMENYTIPNQLFFECTGMTEAIIGEHVVAIGESAFYKCSSLRKLTMPISTETDSNIFTLCTNINNIVLTKGTGECPNYQSHHGWTPWAIANGVEGGLNITIEEGIENIGNYTFYGCNGIKITNDSFKSSSIKSIGNYAFYNCSQISLDFEKIDNDNLEFIGNSAFYGCENMTGRLEFTHTELSRSSFYGCKKIESATINMENYTVPKQLFFECTGMTEVTLGDGVTYIDESAFYKCSSLRKLTMPISIYIDLNTFTLSTSINDIVFTAGDGTCADYGYSDSYAPWRISNNVTGGIKITIGNGISRIGNNYFKGCTGIKTISYKNTDYTNLSSFQSAFEADGGTISSSAFTGTNL